MNLVDGVRFLKYCKPGYRFPIRSGGGKSAQHRATHRIKAGLPQGGR